MGAVRYMVMVLLLGSMLAQAQQATPYVLTEFPIAATPVDECISIKWTGMSRRDEKLFRPDSGIIYYSTSPGGSNIDNYPYTVSHFCKDTQMVGSQEDITVLDNVPVVFNGDETEPPQREIRFRPMDQQGNMGPGVYYYMVGWRTKIQTPVGKVDTTFYSNELQMIVESDTATVLKAPGLNAKTTDLTPTFEWERNPGAPYYHILVTDDTIQVATDSTGESDSISVEGLSIIWEAITTNEEITYGAPDPSGTITASPPPMSPGLTYSWIVLNNYGNHPAYTSYRVFGLPRTFSILGEKMEAPQNISPKNDVVLTAARDSIITLKWTNLDPRANTYKIYIYVASDIEQLGAQMVVWEDEVSAGQFTGDTAEVQLNARSILTDNHYTWKAIAVDDRGAGRAGEVTGFEYQAPTGQLKIVTKENIHAAGGSLISSVAAVEMKVEVLDGSMEAPLLFYSDTKGLLKRDRPEGTYRVTAVKEGFQPLTRTLSVDSGETTLDTFYLERPDATIYGKVVDNLGDPLILATVTGVSEVGDTVRTRTDALGSYVLSCYEADWTIWVGKKGYTDAQARDTSVQYAQNVQMAPYRLALNPNVLSGVIKNENGDPLIGVQVGLLREGVLIDEVPSTPQNGVFSFQVESGTYRLTAGKTGFTSYSKSVDVLESKHLQIAMTSRAAVIKGAVYGKTWSTDRFVYAPITNATIQFIEKSTADTFLTVSDGVYGDFSISLPGGNEYFMHTSAEGYIARLRNATIATSKGQTHTVFDTLSGLATTRGRVTTSNDGDVVDRVTVNLIDDDGAVVATARSDLKGVFEIRDIPDGVYTVHAGKEGIVTDTVRLNGAAGDTACPRVIVNTGRLLAPTDDTDTLVVDSILIRVKEGNRYLTWAVTHDGAPLEGAAVKISSPLRKTLAPGDTVAGVGEGRYMLTIDADTAVIIDLAQHAFTIDDTTAPTAVDTTMDAEGGIDTVRYYHTEELTMPVSHVSPDSITLADGSTTLELVVDNATLDAGCLYYRDVASPVFDSSCLDSAKVESSGDTHNYTFPVSPRKNGSTMLYYFRVRIEDDWYGYATETFTAYVRPDTTRLSRIAIDPASADTLVLPADGEVTFNLKAYYGSKFIPATGLVAADVSWKAKRGTKAAPKNLLSETGGTAVTIDPTKGVLDVVYTLRAAIDTVRRSMAPNASSVDSVMFRISDNDLDSLKVMRVGGEEGPITTSTLAKAEFVAEGINTKGEVVTISPDWSIHPEEAGTISPRGVFKPSRDFFGWVELHADVGEVHGEYNRRAGKEINRSGLKVNYALSRSADTATTGRGCVVVFPDSLLPDGVSAQLGVDMPVVTNRVALNEGEYTVVSKLFDIELWDSRTGGAVPFAHGRTASLILDIPEDYHDVVESGSGDFTIGRWDADSIRWELLDSSAVDVETKTISVALEHFSRYAVLHSMKELKGVWSISPNPFSPRIRPVNEYGRNAPAGTCIRIKPVAKSEPITVQVDIYNLTSERVWSVIKQSAPKNGELRLWWDGTSLRDTYTIGGPRDIETDAGTQIRGERMCRNGRYFVVLTVTANDKKEQYMKPMILFK